VTIDNYGLITVSSGAALGDINHITVRAAYHGKTYLAVLGITKARSGAPGTPGKNGDAAVFPKYRGVTYAPDTANTGRITLKLGGTITVNAGDWVAYMGETKDIWENGLCIRWNGSTWSAIPIKADGNFETNPYIDALIDLTEGAPQGRFMSILVRDLIAKTAMIEELAAQLIQISKGGAIFGGERFTKNSGGTGVVDNGTDKTGFRLGTDGILKASRAEISGSFFANMQTAGFETYALPMVGSIRAYAIGNWINGAFFGTKSSNVKDITRLATGRFFLNLGPGGMVLSSTCNAFGYYTRSESVNENYPGQWINKWGMIMSLPTGQIQTGGDYGFPISFKDSNSDDQDEDPMRFFVMVIG
jgi:hypothetical protein